eukprot:TRINITY_DN7454_c0_g2_i1.p1 TRINITY_DN7454_c0_g2~~TRINITY_DN7454_c0_g2_i1.p1  ORF type:complete len:247 (+),score=48.50 TRINITY_DN7454_c0_g2_i1:42-743(+)
MGSASPKALRLHTIIMFGLVLFTILLAGIAYAVPWYSDTFTYTSTGIFYSQNTTWSLQKVHQNSNILNLEINRDTLWADMKDYPTLRDMYGVSMGFTALALIVAGVIGICVLYVQFVRKFDKVRLVVRIIIRVVCFVLLIVAIIAWGVMLQHPTKYSDDYKKSQNRDCNLNLCKSFQGTYSGSFDMNFDGLGDVTGNEVWGPMAGFWLMVVATVTSFLLCVEVVRAWVMKHDD